VLGSGEGVTTILSFFYTHCPDRDACSNVSGKFAWIQARLAPKEPLRLIEVGIDPEHDTPAALRLYAAAFGVDARRWHLVTGTPAEIAELTRRFALRREPRENGSIAHSELLAVLRPDGSLAERVEGADFSPADALAAAREASGAPASPLTRLGLWWRESAGAICGAGRSRLSTGMFLTMLALLCFGLCGLLLRSVTGSRSSRSSS
jgi:hypothetical protein